MNDQVRVGSITKSMVATVLLQLVGERRLQLDDSIEDWLPGVVPNGEAITLRMLLNHTSGLFDYGEDADFIALPCPSDSAPPGRLAAARRPAARRMSRRRGPSANLGGGVEPGPGRCGRSAS